MKPFKYIGQGRYECGGVVAHFDRYAVGSSEALNVTNAHGVTLYEGVRIAPRHKRAEVLFQLARVLNTTAACVVGRYRELGPLDAEKLDGFRGWVLGSTQPNGEPLAPGVAAYVAHLHHVLTLPIDNLRGLDPDLHDRLKALRGEALNRLERLEYE